MYSRLYMGEKAEIEQTKVTNEAQNYYGLLTYPA
jgi:hypothetical protein